MALVLSKEAEGRVKELWRSKGVVALDIGADARGIRVHPISAVPERLLPTLKTPAKL